MYKLLLIVAAATLGTLYAQSPQHDVHELPVLVDGSKTPDQIPDDLAYHHFILSVAEHQKPAQIELTRRETRLRSVGLSAEDHARAISALAGLREKLDAIESARAENATALDSAVANALRAQEDAAIAGVRAALSRMSPDGQSKLHDYMTTHVKRCIRIYGGTR